jgi:hypothetical protein
MTPERYVLRMTAAPRTPPAFVKWLATRHPGLGPVLDEHLAGNDELLPHVLFGDVTRYALTLAREGEDYDLNRLLSDLDAALGDSEDEVANLVWVSFVENASTDEDEPLRAALRSYPNLARALSHYE